MASVFPTSIDTFTNPVYTKVNGEDVVSAAHVNDLQDAIRAVQETVAGAGKPLDMASNNYIADNTSFKVMIEALDGAIGGIDTGLDDHKNYVLLTDPVQHHSNVIEVTSVGNLASDRVQTALEEHQADIDAIMSGNTVEGITLDDRYVLKAGAQSMQGPITITESLTVNGNVNLGDAAGDTVVVADSLAVGGAANVTGNVTTQGDILMNAGQKIAESGASDDSYIMLGADKLEFYSKRDLVFRMDADDATDGVADAGTFQVRNGLDDLVFNIDEDGVTSTLQMSASAVVAYGSVYVEDDQIEISGNKMDMAQDTLHIQLDNADASATGRFLITQDGDTGVNLASPDVLLNINENAEMVTGIHILKSGIQETGYFGLRAMSDNAGGEFHGAGVNFKHQLTNSPSSVTLTPDGSSTNYSNLSVTDMNQYGFFFEFDTPAIGATKVFGTYTTIGN